MSLGVALYALAVVAGVLLSGGIIEVSENIHTPSIQNQNTQSFDDTYWEECLELPYYPCENNINIKSGDSQTFSVSSMSPFITYSLDGKKVYSGQTYELYASDQNIGMHKLEVNNIFVNKIWYISIEENK